MGLAVVVVLSALAPLGTVAADEDAAELDVAVTQDDEPIVTVTHDGSAVAGANVSVSTAAADPGDETDSTNDTEDDNDSSDDAYAGVGHYTTDENGTVALPEPETTVVVHVTASADNASGSTTTKLTSDDGDENESDAFGATVSAMISDYQDDDNVTLGLVVASYVVSNNPGNAPGHAGPPAHVGLSGDDNETAGPPAHAGGSNETDGEEDGNASDGGPPEHAGGPDDDGNETDDGDSGGPPDHAGGPGDDTDDDSEDDDEADDEDD